MLVRLLLRFGALFLTVAIVAAAPAVRADEVDLSKSAWSANLGGRDVHLVPMPSPTDRLWRLAVFVDGRETTRLPVADGYRLSGVFEISDRWVLLMAKTHGGYTCHSHFFSLTMLKKNGETATSSNFTTCFFHDPHVAQRGDRLQVGFEATFLEAAFFEFDRTAGEFAPASRAFPIAAYAPPADPRRSPPATGPAPKVDDRE